VQVSIQVHHTIIQVLERWYSGEGEGYSSVQGEHGTSALSVCGTRIGRRCATDSIPTRYFQKSLQKNKTRPICPYGKDCFYQHINEDGTPHIFKSGVEESMRVRRTDLFQLAWSLHLMTELSQFSEVEIAWRHPFPSDGFRHYIESRWIVRVLQSIHECVRTETFR